MTSITTGINNLVNSMVQKKVTDEVTEDVNNATRMGLQNEALEGVNMPIVKDAFAGTQMLQKTAQLFTKVQNDLDAGSYQLNPDEYQQSLAKLINNDPSVQQTPEIANLFMNEYGKKVYLMQGKAYSKYRKENDTKESVQTVKDIAKTGNAGILEALKQEGIPGFSDTESYQIIQEGVKQCELEKNSDLLSTYSDKKNMLKDLMNGVTPKDRSKSLRESLYTAGQADAIVDSIKPSNEYTQLYNSKTVLDVSLKSSSFYSSKESKKALDNLAPFFPPEVLVQYEAKLGQISKVNEGKLRTLLRSIKTYSATTDNVSAEDSATIEYINAINTQYPALISNSSLTTEEKVRLKDLTRLVAGGLDLKSAVMDLNETDKLIQATKDASATFKRFKVDNEEWDSLKEEVSEDLDRSWITFNEPSWTPEAEAFLKSQVNYHLQQGHGITQARKLATEEMRNTTMLVNNKIVYTSGKSYQEITGLSADKFPAEELIKFYALGNSEGAKKVQASLGRDDLGAPIFIPGSNLLLVPTNKTSSGVPIDFVPIPIGTSGVNSDGTYKPSISEILSSAQRVLEIGDDNIISPEALNHFYSKGKAYMEESIGVGFIPGGTKRMITSLKDMFSPTKDKDSEVNFKYNISESQSNWIYNRYKSKGYNRPVEIALVGEENQDYSREATMTRITKHEGYREKPYKDHLGFLTGGYGHKIRKGEKPPKGGYTKEYWDKVYQEDLNKAEEGATKLIGKDAHPAVLSVVTEMVFQLGYTGTSKFKKTLQYIKEGSYDLASKEMLDSDWAKQTPTRAKKLSRIIKGIK